MKEKDISGNNLQLKVIAPAVTVITQNNSETQNHSEAGMMTMVADKHSKPSQLLLQISHVLMALRVVYCLRLDEVIQTVQVMCLHITVPQQKLQQYC